MNNINEKKVPAKTGFFEETSGEKSSTRLMSFLTLLFTFAVILIYITSGGQFSDWGFLTFIIIMLTASFLPKQLKEINKIALSKLKVK